MLLIRVRKIVLHDKQLYFRHAKAPFHSQGTKHAAEIGVITKADDIVCAVHAYKAGATKNVAMRFYYAGAAL